HLPALASGSKAHYDGLWSLPYAGNADLPADHNGTVSKRACGLIGPVALLGEARAPTEISLVEQQQTDDGKSNSQNEGLWNIAKGVTRAGSRHRDSTLYSRAKVSFDHACIGFQFAGRARKHNSSSFKDISAIAALKCQPRHLLDQQEG